MEDLVLGRQRRKPASKGGLSFRNGYVPVVHTAQEQALGRNDGCSVVGLGILTVVVVAVNLGRLGGGGKIEWIVVESIHQRLDIFSIS
jgi:hypothetical protein